MDALVFSSVWVALAAAALLAAAAAAMGVAAAWPVVGLAFSGTLVVYGTDRLRDLPRDRATAPVRSDFVAAHAHALTALTALAALASAALALAVGPRALPVLAPALLLGLAHRRLKRFDFAKAVYLTLAWLAVVVGLPAALDTRASHVGWTAATLGGAILANAIASNLRDREAASARLGYGPALLAARGAALAGCAVGLLAPAPVRPLAAVPGATLAVLARFRRSERYGLMAVDGALLAGALLALFWR